MDITLVDLTNLESRLTPVSVSNDGNGIQAESYNAEVSWAVTARATAPYLPALRGGELLLIPPRASSEIGDELTALICQAHQMGVIGLVFADGDPALERTRESLGLVPRLRWTGELNADAESSINRLLTERRGTMFRVGTELERAFNEMTARRTSLNETLGRVSGIAGLTVSVIDSKGRELAKFGPNGANGDAADEPNSRYLARGLALGAQLVLGPLLPGEYVLARFLIERVAMAAEVALRHDDDVRPRGAGRSEAIRALVERSERSPSDRRRSAVALGLEPDGVYLVAVTPNCREPHLTHALTHIGTAHDAGKLESDRLWLLAVSTTSGPEHVAARAQQLKRAWMREQPDRSLTLALSAPTVGVAGLPAAAEEARFIAALQRSKKLQRQAASFDSLDDLGALRVLYQLRQSPELRQFVEQVLGSLAGRETLRSTLRVFLESGGSQVEASKRLGIHRNTLSYRLRRVAALVGVDVTDPAAWLTLHLAICAGELFRLTNSEH